MIGRLVLAYYFLVWRVMIYLAIWSQEKAQRQTVAWGDVVYRVLKLTNESKSTLVEEYLYSLQFGLVKLTADGHITYYDSRLVFFIRIGTY